MSIRKTEFWVITGVVLFVVFFLVQDAALVLGRSDVYVPHYYGSRFLEQGLSFDYLKHHTYPLLTYVLTSYLAFLLAALYIYPKLYLRHNFTGTIVTSLLVYLAMVITFSVADTWYKGYMLVGFGYFFMKNLVLVMLLLGSFVLYVSVKEAVLHYYRRNEGNVQAYEPAVKRELLVIGGIWLGILLVFIFSGEHDALMMAAFWFTMVPLAYFLYVLNRYVLLPEYELKEKAFWPYSIKLLSFSLLLSLPFVALFFVLINDFEPGLFFVLWLGQLLLMGPLSWLVYRAGRKKHNQIATLKQELGQTTADLQFLRSQINPHFLFNALNTLYGTALQENSERTAQGIQMLGDMMR
ncbi:MAG: histidine kinase, partial [Pontibacter sp.]|nr:histidine kinase [Pontibacter sp.]